MPRFVTKNRSRICEIAVFVFIKHNSANAEWRVASGAHTKTASIVIQRIYLRRKKCPKRIVDRLNIDFQNVSRPARSGGVLVALIESALARFAFRSIVLQTELLFAKVFWCRRFAASAVARD
jgi:hypothetical protein